MKKILINYAHNLYYESQNHNSLTGIEIGGFSDTIKYNSSFLDEEFVSKNKTILSENKGAGYWLWKPYIILKTLKNMTNDDILFYCDSGVSFVGSFNDYMFDLIENNENGLILFNGGHKNKLFTKRDCFYYMNCEKDEYVNATQLTATFQFCKKTNFTINFYEEFLKYAQDIRILSDLPNECGKENYEGFISHRHDQSILTNLQIKHNVSLIEDISQFGNNVREKHYKQLVDHHRNKN